MWCFCAKLQDLILLLWNTGCEGMAGSDGWQERELRLLSHLSKSGTIQK